MLKVLHYFNVFSPKTWGGVQEHIVSLADGMRPQVKSSVLASAEEGTALREKYRGVEVYRAPPARRPSGPFSTIYEWTVNEFRRERARKKLMSQIPHDVLHMHGPLAFSGSVFGGAFFAPLFGKQAWLHSKKPVVMTFHGLPELVLPLKYAGTPAARLFGGWKWITNWNVARSRKVICVDRYVLEELSRRPQIDKKKLVFIPNGIDLRVFRPRPKPSARKEAASRFGLCFDGNVPVFLYVNRLSREKGIHDIIGLARVLGGEKFQFIIAGDGPYEKEVRALCAIDSRFSYAGPATQGEVALLMNAADFVFTPLHHPGATRTNIEAVACGTPVITSRIHDRYPIVQGATGFYYDDFNGLAGLARRASRGALKASGRFSKIKEFDSKAVCRKVIAVYRSVL